jgi:Uma2 family endonuclease
MATVATRLVTADEFFEFVHRPENRDRVFELEAGEIVEMSRPGERHGVICGNIAFVFGGYVRQIKSGRVLANDSGLVLDRDPDTVRGPDVSVYLDKKKYVDLSAKYPDEMPVVVIEVLSPNDTFSQTATRLNRFLGNGVAVVWLVEPERRKVTVWWAGQAPIIFVDGEVIADLPGLPEFRCKASEIFDSPGE